MLRSVVYQKFERSRVGEQGLYVVWSFSPSNRSAWPHPITEPHWQKQDDRLLFWRRLEQLQDQGLILSNLDNDIAAHADVPGLAIAVTKNGKIIYEPGFGWADRERGMRATPKTPFALASVSKSITATAIMQLFERGRLNLDAPVNDYLGSAKVHSPHWNATESTVRRVMSHTGGLTTFTRWCGYDRSACNLDREIRDYGILVWRPGDVFDYSNLGFGILGEVIVRVSGNEYDSYLKKNIFIPLGMEGCGLKTRQRASTQYDEKTHAPSPARISGTPGASGLRCSAHDLALFGMYQLKETTNANSILSFSSLDQMHRAQPGTRGQYGLGWWTSQKGGTKVISAQGGTSDTYALLTLVPTKNVAVIVVANSYSQFVSNLGERILDVVVPELSAPAARPAPRGHLGAVVRYGRMVRPYARAGRPSPSLSDHYCRWCCARQACRWNAD